MQCYNIFTSLFIYLFYFQIEAVSNRIHRFSCFLAVRRHLKELNVASNEIASCDHLNDLFALETLNLSHNHIQVCVLFLSDFPSLTVGLLSPDLHLTNNAVLFHSFNLFRRIFSSAAFSHLFLRSDLGNLTLLVRFFAMFLGDSTLE